MLQSSNVLIHQSALEKSARAFRWRHSHYMDSLRGFQAFSCRWKSTNTSNFSARFFFSKGLSSLQKSLPVHENQAISELLHNHDGVIKANAKCIDNLRLMFLPLLSKLSNRENPVVGTSFK